VIRAHDIGLQIVQRDGVTGYRVVVGGGLGRTPMIGKTLTDFLPKADLLPYVEAIVSVWNLLGRRDNKYKARIKITVHEHGIDEIRRRVDARFAEIRPTFTGIDQDMLRAIQAQFAPPEFKSADTKGFESARNANPAFRSWCDTNLTAHRHDELRISHEQNVILPHVHKSDLPAIYAELRAADLATANIGLASDIIACPGMDYCALATARSIPVAQQIAARVDELGIEHDIGTLKIKISGCINACGHHHVGHIGILGLDRAGVENYQITLGGDHTQTKKRF